GTVVAGLVGRAAGARDDFFCRLYDLDPGRKLAPQRHLDKCMSGRTRECAEENQHHARVRPLYLSLWERVRVREPGFTNCPHPVPLPEGEGTSIRCSDARPIRSSKTICPPFLS